MNLRRRLNKSWQKVQRDRHIKAQDLSLTDPEYRLWDLLLATYDWDKTHTETYGCVETTDRELAEILRWSASKVCRTRNMLIKKGLVNLTQAGLYNLLTEENANAPMQSESAQMKQEIVPMQEKVADSQQKQTQTDLSSIVSYKDKYRLVRNDKEYEKMWEEQGKPENFTPEDMKWIDQNV